MNVIRFLLEYTINTIYGGNKSQCARDLGMSYNYFSKICRRTSDGSFSVRIVEDLLMLFLREGISIDDCLRQYTESQHGKQFEEDDAPCVKMLERIKGDISRTQSEAQDITDLMRVATRMSDQLRKIFCADIPDCQHQCKGKCPIAEFGVFFLEIKKQAGIQMNENLLRHLKASTDGSDHADGMGNGNDSVQIAAEGQ